MTGVQISAYRDVGAGQAQGQPLRDLVAAIFAETDVPRVRLTSIAPWDLDESLLDLWRDRRVCRHLRLSLQSGSATVLRRMRRPYTAAQFARAVELARAAIPDVGITTDVIVGFPGESAAEFDASLRFVEAMQFSRVHVFRYSARPGTPAAALPLPVPDALKDARAKAMQAVASASARKFAERLVGRTIEVLWETREGMRDERGEMKDTSSPVTRHPSLLWSGYTDNYVRVIAESDAELTNRIVAAEIQAVAAEGVRGKVLLDDGW